MTGRYANRELAATFAITVAEILHKNSGIIPAEDPVAVEIGVPPGGNIRHQHQTRHVFGRLWWRAHLVHDSEAEEGDLYAALNILGESAFDQIYVRRTSIGGSPSLVRGILRVWEEIDVPRDEVRERALLRELLMRVLRLQAFVSFDSLTADDLDEEPGKLADESLRALTGRA
ncbi:DUF6339 family protein [Streptomyces sp. NBC_00887]|uniref:DUF6339 family protein n=1 Tax=Streptomyces sp. NBC_00887 TaxID=2975859 RepID=UPI00386C3FA6|nr:DUF6339 family protein [Streptomyces sp. NBC_00887]